LESLALAGAASVVVWHRARPVKASTPNKGPIQYDRTIRWVSYACMGGAAAREEFPGFRFYCYRL
jgi:hypothetical protein